MATKSLIEKIEALPPDKKAEVEDFVEFLARRGTAERDAQSEGRFPDELLRAINADRAALFREQGPIDTDPVLRELREHGGR
jgi:hypothetical protein